MEFGADALSFLLEYPLLELNTIKYLEPKFLEGRLSVCFYVFF